MEKDPRIGWSPTTLPAETRTSYAQVIAELGAVLRLHRAIEVTGGKAKKPGTPPAVCGCGRKIRIGKSALAAGPIVCGICACPFALDEDDSDDGGGPVEPKPDPPSCLCSTGQANRNRSNHLTLPSSHRKAIALRTSD